MSQERQKRLLRILEIVSTHRIETQEELVDLLRAEDWDVTQSSVSRDIAALGLIKVKGAYRKPHSEVRRALDPDEERIRDTVLTMLPAGDHLIVIRTSPGDANRVGVAIDRLAWPEVVGTIAGDDTVFAAVRSAADGRRLVDRIKRLAHSEVPRKKVLI